MGAAGLGLSSHSALSRSSFGSCWWPSLLHGWQSWAGGAQDVLTGRAPLSPRLREAPQEQLGCSTPLQGQQKVKRGLPWEEDGGSEPPAGRCGCQAICIQGMAACDRPFLGLQSAHGWLGFAWLPVNQVTLPGGWSGLFPSWEGQGGQVEGHGHARQLFWPLQSAGGPPGRMGCPILGAWKNESPCLPTWCLGLYFSLVAVSLTFPVAPHLPLPAGCRAPGSSERCGHWFLKILCVLPWPGRGGSVLHPEPSAVSRHWDTSTQEAAFALAVGLRVGTGQPLPPLSLVLCC